MSINQLRTWIENSTSTVFFGGAGTSTESDIPDFRTAGGLYSQQDSRFPYRPETIISHSFYVKHKDLFSEYYKTHLLYPEARPNKAHFALAELERRGKLSAVITQNIDGLHQMAGQKNVIELHGSVHENYCERCGKTFDLNGYLGLEGAYPQCDSCGGPVRPDVVLYEEGLKAPVIEAAVEAISQADLLIVGGTSLVVYPAAGLLKYFSGRYIVLMNRDATQMDQQADLIFREPIGEVLDAAVFGN